MRIKINKSSIAITAAVVGAAAIAVVATAGHSSDDGDGHGLHLGWYRHHNPDTAKKLPKWYVNQDGTATATVISGDASAASAVIDATASDASAAVEPTDAPFPTSGTFVDPASYPVADYTGDPPPFPVPALYGDEEPITPQ